MVIANCNGEKASPWKIPLRIITSAKLFPTPVNSTLLFHSFLDKLYDFVGYLEHFETLLLLLLLLLLPPLARIFN